MVYEDDILKNFIKTNHLEQFVRVKEEINKAELKKAVNIDDNGIVTLNGQVVEGITTLPGEESFSIK